MNEWADRKPLKPSDGLFVFQPTMEYSETGITGNAKELTRTFDASGQVVDLPDTATHAFIDLGLTSAVLPSVDPPPPVSATSSNRTPTVGYPIVVHHSTVPQPVAASTPESPKMEAKISELSYNLPSDFRSRCSTTVQSSK